MSRDQETARRFFNTKTLIGAAVTLVIVLVAGVGAWSVACPCSLIPGLVLRGPVHSEPVTDWKFVNDVPLCQIQISTGMGPHALNLNCMATPDGQLYLSCSVANRKYWCSQVRPNHPGRLRLNGTVYPVVLNRVTDPETIEAAWAARVKKLQIYGGGVGNPKPAPDAKRPDDWWTFHLTSAPPG